MKSVAALAVLSLLVLPACRRPDQDATARVKAVLAGAWVRQIRDGGPGLEGFELRADGSAALLGIYSMNGIAWNLSRDELVISTNSDRHAQPSSSRLLVASLEHDILSLRSEEPDYLAGNYRRGTVEHVAGVVTYLERIALPPDARVEVSLRRGERLVARTLITPRAEVPIPFVLSVLLESESDAGGYALTASIFTPAGPVFTSAAPVPAGVAETGVELIVRRAPESR